MPWWKVMWLTMSCAAARWDSSFERAKTVRANPAADPLTLPVAAAHRTARDTMPWHPQKGQIEQHASRSACVSLLGSLVLRTTTGSPACPTVRRARAEQGRAYARQAGLPRRLDDRGGRRARLRPGRHPLLGRRRRAQCAPPPPARNPFQRCQGMALGTRAVREVGQLSCSHDRPAVAPAVRLRTSWSRLVQTVPWPRSSSGSTTRRTWRCWTRSRARRWSPC